jgi:hypothetical protein
MIVFSKIFIAGLRIIDIDGSKSGFCSRSLDDYFIFPVGWHIFIN